MIRLIFIATFLMITTCSFAMEKETFLLNNIYFNLEIPQTVQEYSHGLMYRRSLAPQEGMIFFFNSTSQDPPVMWMKNTLISLDMLFIGPNNRIDCILRNTQPLSLTRLSCNNSIRAVIELKAGAADKYQLKSGMSIRMLDESK